MYTFGERLRGFREREDISKTSLAKTIGFSRGSISNWENGHYRPRERETVIKLAEALLLSEKDTDRLLDAADYSPEYGTELPELLAAVQMETAKIDRLSVRQLTVETYVDDYVPPKPPKAKVLSDSGSLPPGSRVLFHRNASFTGRVEALKTLARALLHRQAAETSLVHSIQGIGGVGKTQLAVEFVYRYGRYFQGVHWLNAAQPKGITSEIIACGTKMSWSDWPPGRAEQLAFTLKRWQSGPYLIILDNLEDVGAARKWLAQLGGGPTRLLITTRRTDWPPDMGLTSQHLDVFSDVESIAFLRHYLDKDLQDNELSRLAGRLCHLPLALELAGHYLAPRSRMSVSDYLERLKNSFTHPSMRGWQSESGSPTNHDLDLLTTFDLSWELVTDKSARRMFILAGYCAPNHPIPYELLQKAVDLDDEACDAAVSVLKRLGLLRLETSEAGPTIHPLLAEYARHQETEFDPLVILSDALVYLTHHANETGLPSPFLPLCQHVEAVASAAREVYTEKDGALWNNLGFYWKMVADYTKAQAAYERAIAIDEHVFGPDHPNVAIRVNGLGLVLHSQGDFEGARAALERALAITEAAYGSDHPEVAACLGNLGLVLTDMGDLTGAQAALERALKIDEAAYGPDHEKTATSISNWGNLLRGLGRLDEARVALERAASIWQATFSEEHPKLAVAINNQGMVLQDMEEFKKARDAYKRALSIGEHVFGPDHPRVATYINNLGNMLHELDELEEARTAFERALAIYESVFSAYHPQIALTLNNLA
jgi:tetratricopeptide (TPR) repeat protein/transcriptional regulator with XRE-family HTH domain